MNHEIRLSPILLIDQNNKQVGEIETREAMRMAEEAGLDLVEIQPNQRPPLCKIMDYGKYRYELSKKERGSRQSSKGNELKEVRLGRSIKIDEHDVGIRVNQARKFLMEGNKVLLVQRFRGREMAHQDLGIQRLKRVAEELSDIAKVETPPKAAGRQMSMTMAPDRPKIESIKRKQEAEKAKAEAESQEAKEAEASESQPAEEAKSE